MKVHLIKVQSISRFAHDNIQSKKSFEVWLSILKRVDWDSLQDIINRNMETLKYTVIKTEEQYIKYCYILEDLLLKGDFVFEDEIELLTLLIEKWDNEHNTFDEINPVELIKSLMEENNLKAVDLVMILGLSKGTISKILNYHKGLSKDTIRRLSEHFKVSQETFNRPYELVNEVNRHFRDANLMNTKKDLGSTMAM